MQLDHTNAFRPAIEVLILLARSDDIEKTRKNGEVVLGKVINVLHQFSLLAS